MLPWCGVYSETPTSNSDILLSLTIYNRNQDVAILLLYTWITLKMHGPCFNVHMDIIRCSRFESYPYEQKQIGQDFKGLCYSCPSNFNSFLNMHFCCNIHS